MKQTTPDFGMSHTERVTIERTSDPREQSVDWTTLRQRYGHNTNNRGSCWFCTHGDVCAQPTQSPVFYGLSLMIRTEFTRRSLDELCHMVVAYVKSEVKEPPAGLTPKQVREHLLYHQLNPSIFIAQSVRSLLTIERLVKDSLVKKAQDGTLHPDKSMINTWMSIQQRITDLHALDPSRMLFNHDATNVSGRGRI